MRCVLKGSDDDVEDRQHEACCAGDGGWPSGFADAGGDPKPPQAAPVKSRGGERCGKGPLSAGQVCDEKTNVCEPLLTHRNGERWHRNRGRMSPREKGAPARACPEPGGGLRAALAVSGV